MPISLPSSKYPDSSLKIHSISHSTSYTFYPSYWHCYAAVHSTSQRLTSKCLLSSLKDVLHPLYDQVMCILYSICKMYMFPFISTRLPLHFLWTARIDLLICSHHLILVHCKNILLLKPGSSLYNMNTNYKCHLNLLLKIVFLFMTLK